jgi:phosphoglycerate dehydrogenase-like enzyme
MKVLITRNAMRISDAIPDLTAEFSGVEFVYCPDRGQAAGLVSDVDVYVGSLNREVFLAAKQLKWIQSTSTGVNQFMAIPELVESDVLLSNVRGVHSVPLSESVIGMILSFTRGIRECIQSQPNRQWGQPPGIRSRLHVLAGTTMGIIGFGSVGRALAARAQAFDMRILALDMFPTNKPDYVAELWGRDRVDDLMRESDYIVMTVPYTPLTDSIVGAEQLALVKPDAMLVLISRGGTVDEAALAQALRENRLAAAAIDVVKAGRLAEDSELWDLDNLLITYHVAGGTQYEHRDVVDILRENLRRFIDGKLPLRNQIDMKLGF